MPFRSIALLRRRGFRPAPTARRAKPAPPPRPSPLAEPRLAVHLGTEGDGLSDGTIAACDYSVKIPMSHGVDSLNVAAASAVAFYQLCKPS